MEQPPNGQAVLYTLLVFVVLFNLSAFADMSASPLLVRARDGVAFVGRHSLTIFLYDRLAMQFGLTPAWYASINGIPVLNELYVLSLSILAPVAVVCGVRGLIGRLRAGAC